MPRPGRTARGVFAGLEATARACCEGCPGLERMLRLARAM